MIICIDWPRRGSTRRPSNADSSSFSATPDTYLRDGGFDQDRMLAVFEQLASGNAKHGFPLSRIVCRMDWAAESRVFVDNVIEFESRVNDVWRHHDDAVICMYHFGQFSGDAVVDILRTHPMVILGRPSSAEPVLRSAGAVSP
jgi:MEDS: MEthanogen/methylotroph, DcmR Sensory domain